jgi:hypothetical protein
VAWWRACFASFITAVRFCEIIIRRSGLLAGSIRDALMTSRVVSVAAAHTARSTGSSANSFFEARKDSALPNAYLRMAALAS